MMRLSLVREHQIRRISRVLIANRGEIAVRVIKTAKRLGIETVAVFSDPDVNALHVRLADKAYRIGEASALSSYLDGKKLVEVAKESSAQAVHPGYGFLSENAEFAELCTKAGVKFIGPSVDAIRAMGQKNRAKEIMIAANVPVLPGYNGTNQEDEFLLEEAKKIGFPVMIKPVYGGGGKGMRITHSADTFQEALDSARSESAKAFGNVEMILEKFVEDPRHVEVQIFGDSHGNFVHLWERDCSIQRRHQKIIEEAPAPGLEQKTRQELGGRAVDAARAVNYEGAGTVEFIMDKESGRFFFMEMNTRLQVEHPVSEEITGVDLVEWQFCVAEGGRISLKQSEIPLNGHAIEARIYAESFDRETMQFMPTAGRVEHLYFPTNDATGIRVDSGVVEGDTVTVHYDPMIAKVVAWGVDRAMAVARLDRALADTRIGGLCNNVGLVRACLAHRAFREGRVSTAFVDVHKAELFAAPTMCAPDAIVEPLAVCEAAVAEILLKTLDNITTASPKLPFSVCDFFRINHVARRRLVLDKRTAAETLMLGGNRYCIRVLDPRDLDKNEWTTVRVLNAVKSASDNANGVCEAVKFSLMDERSGERWTCDAVQLEESIMVASRRMEAASAAVVPTREWPLLRPGSRAAFGDEMADELLAAGCDGSIDARSPIPGVVERIFVRVGDVVRKAQTLAILNAMKMEFVIKAPCDSEVMSVECQLKDTVRKNSVLIRLAALGGKAEKEAQ